MKIIEWQSVESRSKRLNNPVALTIGVFDGIHIGHQRLIQNIVSEPGTESVVVTFRINPQCILAEKTYKGDIFTIKQKLEQLEKYGVSTAVLIDFSLKFSKMSAKTFFESLVAAFMIRKIVVGKYFNFGRQREGGVNTLTTLADMYGYHLHRVDPVFYQEERVSSTRIRYAVAAGHIFQAGKMLGRPFALDLTGVKPEETAEGQRIYLKNQFVQVLPAYGSYSGRITGSKGVFETNIEINDNELRLQNPHGLGHNEIQSIEFADE
ncbi:MAG: FAD synthetase family protein [Spirochaetales bacterium]|nr:FAD synthetase family protein [Spirochaetales bacterium]